MFLPSFMLLVLGADAFTVYPRGFLKLRNANTTEIDNLRYENKAATAASYDPETDFLYVIGTKGDVLNIVDVSSKTTPTVFGWLPFDSTEGFPDAVAVCRSENSNLNFVAISFEKLNTASASFLKLNSPLERDGDVTAWSESFRTVSLNGYDPTSMAWTRDCSKLLIVEQGRPHAVAEVFEDPDPWVELLTEPNAEYPSIANIPIYASSVEGLARHVFTECDGGSEEQSDILQDLEPRSVVIDENDTAYITFPKNNVMARLNLTDTNLQLEFASLGVKDWTDLEMDTANNDVINVTNSRPTIYTFYQPIDMEAFYYNGEVYLATADGGVITQLDVAGCTFQDAVIGSVWIDNTLGPDMTDQSDTYEAALNNSDELGNMYFTNLKTALDGFDSYYQAFTRVTGFGGRGMSILYPATQARVFDSNDTMESYFKGAPSSYVDLFNAELGTRTSTPVSGKDITSTTTGPTPNAISTGLIGSTRVFILANGQVGGLYFFTLTDNGSDNGDHPQPSFIDYYRRGGTSESWDTLYNQSTDAVGEPEIKDIQWLGASGNSGYVAVLSNTAGVVSIYELVV